MTLIGKISDHLSEHIQSMFLWGSLRTWIRQLRLNRGCDRRFIPLAAAITLCRFSTIPLRSIERFTSLRRDKIAAVTHPPIFIIGHWRSGTTHLHNLMSLDEQSGFLNMTQSLMPEFPDWSRLFFKPALTRFTPPTRPMDNMALSPDVPQEDEFAMANMTDAAFYHAWVFPRNGRLYFHRYALLENISEKERDQWKRTYRKLIRNVTVSGNGRRPILKNPVNTGRIKALLEIFPQAKFIYMIRNPYRVFPSTLNLHKKMLAVSSLQSISDDDITENIFLFYEKLLKKYLSEKQLIPRGNLIEVRFEDLETDPLGQLRRIYHELSLPGFETAESQFRRHIERQENYRKNRYEPDLHSDKQIEIRWKFAFDHWGYDPRQ